MKVYLVIPCYRESLRIGAYLPSLCAEMDRIGGVDVVVVEDGSDAEEQNVMKCMLEKLRTQFSCLVDPLLLPDNFGKGGAIYSGWEQATDAMKWVGFVDADGACPAFEVSRLINSIRLLNNDRKVFFASRVKMLGRRVDRLLKRHLLGRIYATLVSEVLHIPVYDSQCGLKLVPREAFLKIKNRLQITGFAFDVELMVSLLDSGYEIEEVPIDWREIPGGKVSLVRDSFRMARDVWAIKKRRKKG